MRNAVEMVRSIALFGVVAFAINVLADEATVNGQTWNYSIQDGKARIERRIDSRTGECGYSGDLIVPTRINGKPVVEVDRYAFSRGTAILSVVIPSGVLLEDKFRFEGCTALKSVKISEPMSEITSAMFENCSALVSVDMPAEVTRIGAWAFYGCTSLKSLNALSVVVEVGEKAFYGCMNLAMTINLGVLQKIGTEAFYDCGKMLFTGSPTLVTRIPDYAFYGCGSLYDMNVVSCITEIGAYAFGCCSNLVSLTGIGDNVLQIGEGAFSGCSKITSMHIPSNLKSIPSSLFRGCKSLECVVMGNGVTNIEKQAFSGCSSLDDMKLSSTLVSIGEYAFSGCPTAFPLPASVKKIDWHVFSAPVDELVLDGCVTKDMEWPFTRREVGTYYDQDPYNGYYYRDYSKDVASGVLKIFEWNDTGENFHLTLEDSWSLYYTDVSITPFRTGREYHEWSPPIVYRRDAEISIVPAARSVIQGRTAISLLAPHEDVELFYTIDGSDPRTNGIKYEQKFSIRGKTTVRAVGYYKGNLTTKELVAKYGTGEVSTPVITSSQPEFNFSGNQIAIACATSGVQIHYTTDGSEPTADSPLYSAPFCIDETTMIKAIAVGHAEYMDSLIAVREFKREWLTVPSPVVSPGDGGSFDTVKGVVTITCPLSGATIYYTTDGTKPTRQSPVYSGPFEIDSDTVVRAFASKVDYLDSAFVKATIYNRQPFAATPVIALTGGGFSFVGSKGVVSIACATEGAVLHYTLDGSTPTAESPIYMEPFGITETTTVKAFASKLGCRDSEVVTATFEKQWAYGDSLDCPDLMFTSEGGDWVNDPNVSYNGNGSLRSPLITEDGEAYSLNAVVQGPLRVSFWWKTSCEKDEWDEFYYDHAEFWVDDELVAQKDGNAGEWEKVSCIMSDGMEHVLTWRYVKDESGFVGEDCVWVDGVNALSVEGKVLPPVIIPSGRIILTGTDVQKIVMSCATPKAEIYYTIDGSDPVLHGRLYTADFVVDVATGESITVRAVARNPQLEVSDVVETIIEHLHDEPPVQYAVVRFDSNGAGINVEDRKVQIGESIGILPILDRNWYAFVGWFTAAKGGRAITCDEKIAADVLYYAHWVRESWNPTDAVLPNSVTGAGGLVISKKWVLEDLESRFGQGKLILFRDMYGDDFQKAVLERTGKFDCNGNPLSVWHDFVAGTDPTDINSRFVADISMHNGQPVIAWRPDLTALGEQREYKIYGKNKLTDNLWASPILPGMHFFKVEVSMPSVDCSDDPNADNYMIVDLQHAGSVSYLSQSPVNGWSDEYKTTKMVLRRIEPGSFKMGDGDYDGGNSTHEMIITKPYYIGVFEVTQFQYSLIMGRNPSSLIGDLRPVDSVSWGLVRGASYVYDWPSVKCVDGDTFMGRLQALTSKGFDLPTEVQWEYACRAGTTSLFNNGGSSEYDLSVLGRWWGNMDDGKGGYSNGHTTVGTYKPNAWGLYDMHGNVSEWCLDWKEDLKGLTASCIDREGPISSGFGRVVRGGNWVYISSGCTSRYRPPEGEWPTEANDHLGFRIALSIQSE